MKQYIIRVNGKAYDVEVEEVKAGRTPRPVVQAPPVKPDRIDAPVVETPKAVPPPKPAAGDGSNRQITSPMAGTIANILVKTGDTVSSGDVLLVLEAMKMENDVMASVDGTIRSIEVDVGKSVNAGDLLITLE